MGLTLSTSHLSTLHTVRQILLFIQEMWVNWLAERRPSTARLKLIGTQKQRFASGYINIDAWSKLIIICIIIRTLGGGMLGNLVL